MLGLSNRRAVSAGCAVALLMALPAFATAQEFTFTPLPAPAERPYPYEILGMQPGDSLADVLAVMTERSEAEPQTETEIISVQSPDGRSLEFTYERSRSVGVLSLNDRIAKLDFPESITVGLLTDVMEQRPFDFNRSMQLPTGELPTAQELQAQMEETYGPPTVVATSSGTVTLTYAWDDTGFIADYATHPVRDLTFVDRQNREQTVSYQPCNFYQQISPEAYAGRADYGFQYPRKAEIMPGCIAVFSITHITTPGSVGIIFTLSDYELARQHRDETDRQIVEFLTGEQTVEPSNLDL